MVKHTKTTLKRWLYRN